ncbi:MAG: aldo/keto reductase [Candidatus Latescibacterota bacterium]|nr:aldo/keto reductase [Candidatus Latescibacterota bacterium]
MDRITLGGTDLEVSRLCMGTMTFGGQADEAGSKAMWDTCLEVGINFFDTANVYTKGRSEEIIGRLMKGGKRADIVLATKVGSQQEDDTTPLSRASIHRHIDASLQRLQTDYVDLYYMHKPDYETPIEESLEAMAMLVQAGKVRYVASSNAASWQIARMHWLADRKTELPKVTVSQPMYNLIARSMEPEFVPMCRDLGVSTVVYNPLAGGLLTGKHRREVVEEGGRFDVQKNYVDRYWNNSNFDVVAELAQACQQADRSLVSTAFGWLLHHSTASAIIIGASKVEQLEENLHAVEEGGELNSELLAACERAWDGVRGAHHQYNR